MHQLSPKPKALLSVRIPDRLREALGEVWHHIKEVQDEPDNGLEYDDGIQADGLIGGRCGTAARPFVFTYYPTDHSSRDHWYLTLSPTEIEEIVDGGMTRIKMHCCTSPGCRMKFREPDGLCFYCDYGREDVSGKPAAE